MLFPYRVFASVEQIVSERKCSVCGAIKKKRNKCSHKVGEIFNGEMVHDIVTKIDRFQGVALVRYPFDEGCLIIPHDTEYNFENVKRLTRTITNPFCLWKIHINSRNEKKGYIKQFGQLSTPVQIVNRNYYDPEMYELALKSMELLKQKKNV